jgi:hypothetical protein
MTHHGEHSAPFFSDNEVITLSKDGVWLADGQEITHEGTCQLFSRNLKKDAEGYYIEVTGRVGDQIRRETKRIQVEDTAFFVQRLEGDPAGGYELFLSDGMKISLDPGTLRYRPGRLTCRVVTPIGEEEAKFLRMPYFDLLQHLEEDDEGYFLNFSGSHIRLARK